MKTARILHLDGNADEIVDIVEDLAQLGVNLEIHPASETAGHADAYHGQSAERQGIIANLTQHPDEIDLVVIGNNMGAGVQKAKAVADKARGNTIIVYNTSLSDVEPYSRLGIKHFCCRSELFDKIKEVLGL